MTRFARLLVALSLVLGAAVRTAHAQPAAATWSAQVDVAATLGNTSSTAIGGEVDRRLNGTWDLFIEAGHMSNITSSALKDRAKIIGDAIAAESNPIQSAIYYDLGLKFHLMPDGKWNPYITLGFGATRVNTSTSFSKNGTQLTDSQVHDELGVELGLDLDGYVTKPFFMGGFGVQIPVKENWFLDGSYRYGMIFARTGVIEGDKKVNTQRVQVGLGLRF